MNSWLAEGNDD